MRESCWECSMPAEARDQINETKRLYARVKELAKALEFYADTEANYFDDTPGRLVSKHYGEYTPDRGRVAREALGYDPVEQRRESHRVREENWRRTQRGDPDAHL
jgi:hypothetical protein